MTTEATAVANEAADAAAEQAAAEASFNSNRGSDQVSAEQVREEPEQRSAAEIEADEKAAQIAQDKANEEEWLRGVPASVRVRLERLPALEETARQVGAYARNLKALSDQVQQMGLEAANAKQAADKAAADAGRSTPTAAQIEANAKLAKWEALKDELPEEWRDGITEFVMANRNAAPTLDADGIRRMAVEAYQQEEQRRQEELANKELQKLDKLYPDWKSSGASLENPDFLAWLQKQPPETQELAESMRAVDALKLVRGYQESKSTPPANTPASDENAKNRLQRLVAPTRANTAGVTRAEMTEQEAAEEAFRRKRAGG